MDCYLVDKIIAAPVVQNLYKLAVHEARTDGLYMEFGVATGRSLASLRRYIPLQSKLYGFDSFEGLPEPWLDKPTGSFATSYRPKLPNTQLIEGRFQDTVPSFAISHPYPVSLIHIDCDLYSSTKVVLEAFYNQIIARSVVIFDELFGYEGFEKHEFRALAEFDKPFEVIGRWDAFRAAIRVG